MKVFLKKRISIMAIGIVSVLLVIGVGVGFYMYAPSNMIALDINPSIELHTNRLNRVVSINPVNEDAIQLMTGYYLEDRDLETVIEDIVDRMIFGGYLTEGQENQILITADDSNPSEELLGRVNAVITTYLQEKQMKVQLLQQNMVVTEEEEEVAHANNVSAGKMAIVDKLLENSNRLTTEELASTSIKELIRFSIDQNISLEDLIENYSEVLEDQLELEDFANTDDKQIDALSSATMKAETSVLPKDIYVTKNDTVVGNKKIQIDAISSATVKAESNVLIKDMGVLTNDKVVKNDNVQIDAVSSATVKTDAGVSGKGEYADGKAEDKDDFDQEDNDYEDNDYEDNDKEDNDNEDNDIEDKDDQDNSEEDELAYSRDEDNDEEDDDDDDDDDDDEDSNGEDD